MARRKLVLALCGLAASSIADGAACAAEGRLEVNVAFQDGAPEAAALRAESGAPVRASLKLVNLGRERLSLATDDAVLPELVDRLGGIAPFDYGVNIGRARRPGDQVVIPSGGSAALAVVAMLRLSDGQLTWSGADGVMGRWRVSCGLAPYRLRFRVHAAAGPGAVTSSIRLRLCAD